MLHEPEHVPISPGRKLRDRLVLFAVVAIAAAATFAWLAAISWRIWNLAA